MGGGVSSPQTEPEEHTTDPHNQNSGSTHPISGVPLPTIPNGRVREPIRASTNSQLLSNNYFIFQKKTKLWIKLEPNFANRRSHLCENNLSIAGKFF